MMRLWSGALAVAFVAVMTAAAQAQSPVNAKCPVKTGSSAKSSITTQYKGKVIGFC